MKATSITLRAIEDADIRLVERWLAKDHVRPWFTDPGEWLREIRERNGEFSFISHFIASLNGLPFAFCQYYPCAAAAGIEDDFAMYGQEGLYGVDYMVGEESFLGKGYGKAVVSELLARIFAIPCARMAVAKPDANNAASRGTLESCGFKLDAATGAHCLTHADFAR